MCFAGNLNIYFAFGALIFINPWPNIKFSEKLMDLGIFFFKFVKIFTFSFNIHLSIPIGSHIITTGINLMYSSFTGVIFNN